MRAGPSAPCPLACDSPGGAVDRGLWPSRWTSRYGPVEVESLPGAALSVRYRGLIGPRSETPVLRRDGLAQRSKRAVLGGPADAPHEVVSIGDVVERGEPIGEQLLRPEEVRQV